jgi:hypothetical protein
MRGPILASVAAILIVSATLAEQTSSPAGAATDPGAANGAGAPAAASPPGPCAAGPFRQFDFWAGAWDVDDRDGKLAGHNDVTIEERGCVLVERWKSVAGNTGLSVNFYDPRAKSWTQQWIGLGVLLRMTGGMRDGAMVLEGPLQNLRTGRLTRLRGTWSSLPDGRVRQHFEESSDDGKTWEEWFDGYYRRTGLR